MMNDFEQEQRYYSKFDVPPHAEQPVPEVRSATDPRTEAQPAPTAEASMPPDASATPLRDTTLYREALDEIMRLQSELNREKVIAENAIAECHRLLFENVRLRRSEIAKNN